MSEDDRARAAQAALQQARDALSADPDLEANDERLGALADLLATYRADSDPRIRETLCQALGLLGDAYQYLSLFDESIASFDELIALRRGDDSLSGRQSVAAALLGKAVSIRLSGRWQVEAELAALNEVISSYAGDADPELRDIVAWALHNKGGLLADTQHFHAAQVVYRRLVADYRHDPAPAMRHVVGDGLLGIASVWAQVDRPDEALGVYQQVIDEYHGDSEYEPKNAAATAMHFRAEIFEKVGRSDAAIAQYQELITYAEPIPGNPQIMARQARERLAHLLGGDNSAESLN